VGSTSSAVFTGSSTYSTDFQNVITRAVNIASLPITQLTNEKAALSGQSSELQTIGSKFAAVQSAVTGVEGALNSSCVGSVSDQTVAGVSVGAGAVEGSFSLLVSDTGAYSTMLTGAWNADAGSPHTYKLSIGANESYDITPSDNSAASVAAAINLQHSDEVHATVVNVGSTEAPDYRISLQSARLTSDAIDLSDGGTSLSSVQTPGKPAQYQVNNSGKTVTSDSRIVNLADGISVNLLAKSADPVTISVTRSATGITNAVSILVNAYNNAVAELQAQRGQSGGALQGQSIVTQLSEVLSGIATYNTSGKIGGLADLGITLGDDGKLSFDSSVLLDADPTNFSNITAFFGSSTGGGLLKSAKDALNSVQDSTNGLLAVTKSSVDAQVSSLTDSINDKQDMVDALQSRLESQMAAADAMIASMQQQAGYMTNMFQAMQTNAQQNSK
jgi:flagellar hook-associated protein 2